MKSQIKIDEFVKHLPEPMQEGLDEALKDVEEPTLHRTAEMNAFRMPKEAERTVINYASTRTVDRDKEIVDPRGMDLTQFRKAPVLLYGHRWSEPPIGKDEVIASDGFGIMARSLFAETPKAEDIWNLVKNDFLRTSSIGFIPTKYLFRDRDCKEFEDFIKFALKNWPEFTPIKAAQVQAIFPNSILLEHSIVSVPANIDALVIAVSEKGLIEDDAILDELLKGLKALRHNSAIKEGAPGWVEVDKDALPWQAFVWQADGFERDKAATWEHPHHTMSEDTMYLHPDGLSVAWAAAHGVREEDEASDEVKAYLRAHRTVLGLSETEVTPEDLDCYDAVKGKASATMHVKLVMTHSLVREVSNDEIMQLAKDNLEISLGRV